MILLPHFLPFLMFPVNDLNICIFPKCIRWNPNPVWWYLEIGPLGGHGGQMRSWGWGPHDGLSSPLRRDTELSWALFLPPVPICMWEHSKKAVVWEPEIELSPETNPADTLISDLPPQSCEQINACWLCHQPSPWHFVVTAQADSSCYSFSNCCMPFLYKDC